MNIRELKIKIENLPDDMDVYISERKTEFSYGLLNSVFVKDINLMEDPSGDIICSETVLVLDEE